MFLILMVVGLVGLVMMAIPAFGRHGHASTGHGGHLGGHGHATHLLGHGHGPGSHAVGTTPRGALPHATASTSGHAAADGPVPTHALVPAETTESRVTRFIPSPRAVFSVVALYGAFGNALINAAHLTMFVAVVVAVLPALLVEWFAIRPLWNWLLRFQGKPSAPLEELLFEQAEAVTAFHNGRGIVSVVRDGRLVQFTAHLRGDQLPMRVKVGDRLRVDDVDAERERLIVSVLIG